MTEAPQPQDGKTDWTKRWGAPALGTILSLMAVGQRLANVQIPRLGYTMLILAAALIVYWAWARPSDWPKGGRLLVTGGGLALFVIFGIGLRDLERHPPPITDPSTPQPKAKVGPQPRASSQTPAPNLIEVLVGTEDRLEIPKFSVNHVATQPDEYRPGMATFRLPAGSYDVLAEYMQTERICEAIFSVPSDLRPQAKCHYR